MKSTIKHFGLLMLTAGLSVAGSNAYALAETESNGLFTLAGSNAVADGLQTLTGAIAPSQDRDIFSFYLAAGSNFSVNINSLTTTLGTFDINMGLFNAGLQSVASNDAINSTNAPLTFSVLTAGTYYLAVSAFANNPLDAFGNNLNDCGFWCNGTTFSAWSGQGFGEGTYSLAVASVPEPANVALMLSSLGLIGLAVRRRQNQV